LFPRAAAIVESSSVGGRRRGRGLEDIVAKEEEEDGLREILAN
jgi:hypothetical protein